MGISKKFPFFYINYIIMNFNRPKILVFSGACHSGKTTSMNFIKDLLESKGKKVVFLSEIIRSYNISSIDDIRRDPNMYMDLQDTIITEKIMSEIKAYQTFGEDTIVLVDRAITDSFFYFTFYVNKNELDDEHYEKFVSLYSKLDYYLKQTDKIYTYVFEFEPIKEISEEDSFRPKRLKQAQNIEYEMIKKYNELFFKESGKLVNVNLNDVSLENTKEYWNKLLKKLDIQ